MNGVLHVAIVGRDAAAWLTALALRRAFAPSGLKVTVVELPSLLHAVDVHAALPSLAGLHRLLGLDEAQVIRASSGLPVTGQRFVGWSGEGSTFVHGYDTQRLAIDELEFLQFWVKARGEGLRVAYEDFSPAAAAAKQGRVGRSDKDSADLGALQHGYHLDARGYVALIRRNALRSGVARVDGFASAQCLDGGLSGIRLHDGSTIEADLYIDASGAEALLIGALDPDGFESWDHWLPADRVLVASGRPLRPLPAFAEVTATASGWTALHPLQDRTALVACYRSDLASEQEIIAAAALRSGLDFAGDVIAAPFASGFRPKCWIGNCVAIGEAAVALEPLDAAPLHIVHAGISNLVALFPVDAEDMPEAAPYAAAMARHSQNLRDFQIAHYRLNRREGPLWAAIRTASGPASLDAKLRLFAARGRVALFDDETFQESSWSSVLLGQGLIPRTHDPLVDKVPPAEQMERFRHLLHVIAREVREMPDVEAWLGAQAG